MSTAVSQLSERALESLERVKSEARLTEKQLKSYQELGVFLDKLFGPKADQAFGAVENYMHKAMHQAGEGLKEAKQELQNLLGPSVTDKHGRKSIIGRLDKIVSELNTGAVADLAEDQGSHAERASKTENTKALLEIKEGKLVANDTELNCFMDALGPALLLMGEDVFAFRDKLSSVDLSSIDPKSIDAAEVIKQIKAMETSLREGVSLDEALEKLDSSARVVLKHLIDARASKLDNIVLPLLNHGPIVEVVAIQSPESNQQLVGFLEKLREGAKSRTELVSKDASYSGRLAGFKQELAKIFAEHEQALKEFNALPAELQQPSKKRHIDVRLRSSLAALAGRDEFKNKIASEDLAKLITDTTKVRKQASQDGSFMDKFADWKEILFSKVGFAAITTMLPALATALQGLLRMIGLGKVAAPLTGLAHGAGAIAEKAFHMVYLFSQQETNKALAAKVEPPLDRRSAKTQVAKTTSA